MCIRDSPKGAAHVHDAVVNHYATGKYALDLHPDDIYWCTACLLYTSDAADERSSVDLGGRRIIKKKNNRHRRQATSHTHTADKAQQQQAIQGIHTNGDRREEKI